MSICKFSIKSWNQSIDENMSSYDRLYLIKETNRRVEKKEGGKVGFVFLQSMIPTCCYFCFSL